MRLNTEHLSGLLQISPKGKPVPNDVRTHYICPTSDAVSLSASDSNPEIAYRHAAEQTHQVKHPEAGSELASEVSTDPSSMVPAKLSGYEIGLNNELEILMALAKFHWLTSRQLGIWVWPNGSQSLQMTQTTLRRLKANGEVLGKILPNGVWAYTLSYRGAKRIRSECGIDVHAKRFRHPGHWMHRAICNWYLIMFNKLRLNNPDLVDKLEFYSEYEIRKFTAPLSILDNKIPDALIKYRDKDGLESLWWIEVENSRRSKKDVDTLCNFVILKLPEYASSDGRSVRMFHLVGADVRLLQEVARLLSERMVSLGLSEDQRFEIARRVELSALDISPGLKTIGFNLLKVPLYQFWDR